MINITDIKNQTFIFDYIVYSPSFSSLDASGPASTAIKPVKTSASTRSAAAIATQTRASGNSGQGGANQPPNQPPNTAIPINIGAVVGGNVGIAILFVVVVITFIMYKRKRRSMPQNRAQTQVVPVSLYITCSPLKVLLVVKV